MNRKEAAVLVKNMEVIKAYSEGKTVQLYNGLVWQDLKDPQFNDNWGEYRVKPEPVKVKVKLYQCLTNNDIDAAVERDWFGYDNLPNLWKCVSDVYELEAKEKKCDC